MGRETNLLVNALLDINTRSSAAALAMVKIDSEVNPADSVLDICVVKDDVGALPAKLQSNLLQVAVCGSFHDEPADNGGACECNLIDVHVGGDRSPGNSPDTRDSVDDTRRETSFLDKSGSDETAQWCLLRCLDDNYIAGGDGRTDLPGPHEQWEIPSMSFLADVHVCEINWETYGIICPQTPMGSCLV